MSADDDAFREQVRAWLAEHLAGEWASLKGLGGSGHGEHAYDERRAWNRHLAEHGWTCLGWPEQYGGRGLSLTQQVIFHEEYARADAPELVNHLGEQLLGPTLIEFGTDEQKETVPARHPDRRRAVVPGLLRARRRLRPRRGQHPRRARRADEWVVDGQKVWTSWAQESDWIFVIARTEPGSSRHHGLSFLLVPLKQDGVEIRPIEQITGGSEFNEVFFSGARTPASMIVGEPGDGWKVAMALLGFERGVSVLGQQVGFERELNDLIDLAREQRRPRRPGHPRPARRAERGVRGDAGQRRPLPDGGDTRGGQRREARLVRLAPAAGRAGHGGLRRRVADGQTATQYDLDRWQRLFLFSRADTLYGGSDEIQRNIIAERVLGLPKEARG